MKSTRVTMAAVGAMIFASGCFSVKMDGERRCEGVALSNQLTVESVDSVVPDLQWSGAGSYSLRLFARGRFVQHSGKRIYRGKPCVGIGIWPGALSTKDPLVMPFASLLVNFACVGVPTLSSLLVEPFRDYYYSSSSDFRATDFGLIGCRKYIAEAQCCDFKEESRKVLQEASLFAYRVEIDGVPYADLEGNTGYLGQIYFTTNKRSGSSVRIKIVGAPSARSDSADQMADLVGVEMIAVLP